jgi:2-keto-4-pentenoate hydratase/2-oxohepta-3-ene-1,7-dioic acid hydratase in catechol pathway
MRFISYSTAAGEGVGLRSYDGYRGLGVAELGSDLRTAIGKGGDAVRSLGQRLGDAPLLKAGAFRLLPPIPTPDKIFCIGLNYRRHAEESGQPIPDYPVVFSRYPTSVVAHDEPLVRPSASTWFDYEAELAVIIGKPGRHITKQNALDHVAGYSVFNDGSIRDYQIKTSQWGMGKNFDASGSWGPELVTPDELPAGAKGLRITARLNGETLQDSNTDDMIFDVPTLIATLSEAITLAPGDVVVTGTPEGVGAARKPPLWMKPGDICEIEIGDIGVLSNTIVQEGA